MKNRKVREMPCMYCKKQMRKVVPWFSDSAKNYFALGYCQEHGLLKGRIRIKTAEDYTGVFAVRTIKPCSEEDEANILRKRDAIKERRKTQRKNKAENKRAEKAAARAQAENQGAQQSANQGAKKPANANGQKPANQGAKKPAGQNTGQGTKKPANQGTKKPADQKVNTSADQIAE